MYRVNSNSIQNFLQTYKKGVLIMKKLLLPLGLLLSIGGLHAGAAANDKIKLNANCGADDLLLERCKSRGIDFDCNTKDIKNIKMLCGSESNAAGDMIIIKNLISASDFINLGKINSKKNAADKILMPEAGTMTGFVYIPTIGEHRNRKVWYIIRDDSSAGVPIIKIYRTVGKTVTKKTLWTEMGTVTNKNMGYEEFKKHIDQDINNNEGIIIQPDGTVVLDFLAADQDNKMRIVFDFNPLQ